MTRKQIVVVADGSTHIAIAPSSDKLVSWADPDKSPVFSTMQTIVSMVSLDGIMMAEFEGIVYVWESHYWRLLGERPDLVESPEHLRSDGYEL